MRKMTREGPCAVCGTSEGPFWRDFLRVLDFGVPGVAPIEPRAVGVVLCDDCEARCAAPQTQEET